MGRPKAGIDFDSFFAAIFSQDSDNSRRIVDLGDEVNEDSASVLEGSGQVIDIVEVPKISHTLEFSECFT
jgi:hypothetical protein